RRLPGARRAYEEDELALLDHERGVLERDDVRVVHLADVLEDDHRPCGSSLGRARRVIGLGLSRRVGDECGLLHGGHRITRISGGRSRCWTTVECSEKTC